MDFLRRHAFFILCGVAGAGGIALGVIGLKRMPAVLEEMKKVEGVYRNLNALQSQPVNQARLDAERRRIEQVVKDREKVFKKARELYGYEPLVPGLFPECDPENLILFRDKYHGAMEDLLKKLNYGGPATRDQIAQWEEKIEEERAAQREIGLDRDASVAVAAPSGPAVTAAGVLTKAGARENAAARAHMAVAQRIYCYGVHFRDEKPPERVASLEFDPEMKDIGTVDAPLPEDAWRAQVAYWIQKDVVEAIVAINEEAARQVRERGETPWVGNLPVKDVISIRTSYGYVLPEGEEVYGGAPGGYDAPLPPGTPLTVFTRSASNDWYEVMQFTVKLVMDQRDIPLLLDRLCKGSFHTPLRVSYEAVPPNRKMIGKIYGSEPVVNVVMDFETILLGEVFRPLMPQQVCEDYEIACPTR